MQEVSSLLASHFSTQNYQVEEHSFLTWLYPENFKIVSWKFTCKVWGVIMSSLYILWLNVKMSEAKETKNSSAKIIIIVLIMQIYFMFYF